MYHHHLLYSLELVRYADLIAAVFDYGQHIHQLVLFAERETGGSASAAGDSKRKKTKLFSRNKGGECVLLCVCVCFTNYATHRHYIARGKNGI